jgi:hypothetical protein
MHDQAREADETPILGDEDRVRLNRAWWDERVAAHLTGQFYDIDGFLADRSTLRPFEAEPRHRQRRHRSRAGRPADRVPA